MSDSDELDVVALAKQQRAGTSSSAAATARNKPLPSPRHSGAASPRAAVTPAAAPAADSDSDSEPFDIVAAAKKSSTSKALAGHSRAASTTSAAAAPSRWPAGGGKPAASPRARSASPEPRDSNSDSDDGLDMLVLAKQRNRRMSPAAAPAGAAGTAAAAGASNHSPPPPPAPPSISSRSSFKPAAKPGVAPSSVAARPRMGTPLAASASLPSEALAPAAALEATAGTGPATSFPSTHLHQLRHSITLLPADMERGAWQSADSSSITAPLGSTALPAGPQQQEQQQLLLQEPSEPAGQPDILPSRTGTVLEGPDARQPTAAAAGAPGSTMQDLALLPGNNATELLFLPFPSMTPGSTVAHSRQASVAQLAAGYTAAPAGLSPLGQTAIPAGSRSPSRMATQMANENSPARAPVAAPTAVVAASAPASPSSAVPLASLAELGAMVQQSMSGVASELRSDIGRLEAGWQAQWQEQTSSTADLRSRLDRLQASSTSQAQEVQGRLEGMQAELCLHRSRLEAVERLQQVQQQAAAAASATGGSFTQPTPAIVAPALEASAPGILNNPVFEPAPAPAPMSAPDTAAEQGGSMPSVEAIIRRLSLLEGRVGAQLHHIETVCVHGGKSSSDSPRSAPISPMKSGGWDQQPFSPASRSQSRAAQAAAVAAAAVYGSASQASEAVYGGKYGQAWDSFEAGICAPGSPRIMAGGLARPTSAAAGYGVPLGGSLKPGYSGGGSGGSSARRSKAAVDQQVAETHAIIAGIQGQIASIKSSLAHTTMELDARRLESRGTVQRLDRLEITDRHMVEVEADNVAGTSALEQRVRFLEDKVAAVSRQAAAGSMVAQSAQTAVSALEWRMDKSTSATIATIKALESRQDKLRSDLHSVAATATLADAKGASLAAEVARLQRRIHSPLPAPTNAGFRL